MVPRRTVPRQIFKDFVKKAIVDVYLVIFILLIVKLIVKASSWGGLFIVIFLLFIIGTKILSSVLTLSAGHT